MKNITTLSVITTILCAVSQGCSAKVNDPDNLRDALRSPIGDELPSLATAHRLVEELTSAFNETGKEDDDLFHGDHDEHDHAEHNEIDLHDNHDHDHDHDEHDYDEQDEHEDEVDLHDNHDHHDHSSEEKQSEFESSEKPWGKVIAASLIINLTTVAAVILIAGHWLRNLICPNFKIQNSTKIFFLEVLVPMFACGAILATTFFLLFPESFHIINNELNGGGGHDDHRLLAEDDHEDHDEHGENEAAATWRWGSSIMGGFWIPLVLQGFFPHEHNHGSGGEHQHQDNTTDEKEAKEDDEKKPIEEDPEEGKTDNEDEDDFVTLCGFIRMRNVPLFVSYNLAEFFHNFTDGIFVGAAFLGCGRDLQLSIMIATIYHELPNQLAGYLVMVNQCGLNPFVALLCNFIFGLSIVIGGLLVLAFDFNFLTIGCLLAMGGGTYLHVAISELLGNAQRYTKKGIHTLYMFICFLVGAVPIGLILLNHHHC